MKLACLLALAALAGCKKHAPRPAPPPPEPPGMQLINAGAQPRRLLRYALPAGTRTDFELAVDASLRAGTQGGPMPTITLDLELTVESVLPDGRMQVRTTVTDAGVRAGSGADVPPSLTSQVQRIKGVAIAATLLPTGALEGAHVDAGAQALPQDVLAQLGSLSNSLEQTTMPLPDVPVGPGASWKTTRALVQNGMKMTTVETVELTAIDGDKLTFSDHSEISGPDQAVTQQGVTIQVSKIRGTGHGHGTIDLGKLAMTREYDAEFHTDMTAQGEDTPMTVTMKMAMTPK